MLASPPQELERLSSLSAPADEYHVSTKTVRFAFFLVNHSLKEDVGHHAGLLRAQKPQHPWLAVRLTSPEHMQSADWQSLAKLFDEETIFRINRKVEVPVSVGAEHPSKVLDLFYSSIIHFSWLCFWFFLQNFLTECRKTFWAVVESVGISNWWTPLSSAPLFSGLWFGEDLPWWWRLSFPNPHYFLEQNFNLSCLQSTVHSNNSSVQNINV